MAKIKKIPELRFKGFTEEWKEKELGTVANITTGKLDANAMKENGQYDFYTSGIQKYRINIPAFEGPAITIARNGATVGFMHLADGKFNAYQRTYVLSEIEADRDFLFSEIGNVLPIKISQEARTGNIPYIVRDMLTNLVTFLPAREEQTQIGSFFENLDTLIALHQRKHDKLLAVKKAMLEKMFPKEGADIPEIRFKGFTGKWEGKKLEDLGSIAMNKRIYKEQTAVEGEIPFYKIGTFGASPDAYIPKELFKEYKTKYAYPEIGDILISASGSIGRTIEYMGKDEYFQDSNIVWLKHDNQIANTFLKHFYSVVKWSGLEGSTIKRLYNRNILETSISLPHKDEQEKIGLFLSNLDSLISLHQQELDKLKNIKKACLEKMFV